MCNENEHMRQHTQRIQPKMPQQEQEMHWENYQAPQQEQRLESLRRIRGYQERISNEEREQLRRKSEYTFQRVNDSGEIHHAKAASSQQIKHINDAIIQVLGDQIYEHVQAIQMSESEQDRTVKLHHARGTQLVDQGKQVFKYRFAGTGFKQWRQDQNGLRGKASYMSQEAYDSKAQQLADQMRELADRVGTADQTQWTKKQRETYQSIQTQMEKLAVIAQAMKAYGESVQINGQEKKYVLRKSTMDGKKVTYSIAGALANGTNYGAYSIENNVESFLQVSKQDLESIFRKWEADGQPGEDIHLLIRGHSRGGVASIIAAMKLQKWINDNWSQYAKKVRFDVTQYDPVAGFTSNWKEKAGLNIRGDEKELAKRGMAPLKHAETTVVYSLHTNYPVFFRPQDVRGAKRVILTPFKHSAGLDQLDESQVRVRKDEQGNEIERREKAHVAGYTDLKTGEVYRQTGLSELDTGLYILDQGNHLVKIDNYEQAEKIIDLAVQGTHSQWRRHSHIKDIAKAWFQENQSVDELQKQAQENQSQTNEMFEQVLGSQKQSVFLSAGDSRQMTEVKEAVRRLRDALAGSVDTEQIRQQCAQIADCYQDLIEKCQTYTGSHTPFTATGRARKHMIEQLLKRSQAEWAYFSDYTKKIQPVLENAHEGEPFTWERVLLSLRSVRMDKLSDNEAGTLDQLKNGASDTVIRGNKTYRFQRENDLLAQSSSVRKDVAACDLAELLGLPGLYEQARFAEAQVKENGRIPAHTLRGVLTRESGGEPLGDVIRRAQAQNKRLQYSPQAWQQMQMIRAMDVLMGHFTRGENDFQVQIEEEQVQGGMSRVTVTQVRSKNHEDAFEEKSLDEQYQGSVTFRTLFGSEQLSREQKTFLGELDSLSDDLIDFRLGHALTAKELAQLKIRVHEVQRLYRLQKQTGVSDIF